MSNIQVHFINPNTDKQTAELTNSFIMIASIHKLQKELEKIS